MSEARRSKEQLDRWATAGEALFWELAGSIRSADDALGVLMATVMAMFKSAPTKEKRAIVLENIRTLLRALEVVEVVEAAASEKA